MSNNKKHRVFLSYASEDLIKVFEIYEGLLKRNLDVWFDKKNIMPGPWKSQIEKAIAGSRYFIICISEAAIKKLDDHASGFQDEELHYAHDIALSQPSHAFTIIPIRLENCSRGDFRLTKFQQYDLFDDIERGLDSLAVDIGGISLTSSNKRDERTVEEKFLDSLFAKAAAGHYAERFKESISIYDSILELSPNNEQAWYNRGINLRNLGQFEDAVEAFEKALEINPELSEAWTSKGFTLDKLAMIEEAIEAFDKALEINPEDYWALIGRGIALLQLGKLDEASEAANKILNIDNLSGVSG